ncbi:bluetail domain-containing putative surface protein [Acinetobacter johnsonii]
MVIDDCTSSFNFNNDFLLEVNGIG